MQCQERSFGSNSFHNGRNPLPDHDPLEKELANFVECVRDGNNPMVSGEHGLQVLQTAYAVLDEIDRARAAAKQ